MHEIVVERIAHASGDAASLVEQIDELFEEICDGLRSTASEAWLQGLRNRFWQRQLELIDGDDTFRIRMAVPGFFNGGLRVMVNESAIDVLSEGSVLIRRISFLDQLDLRSVSATLHDGYLHITGAKAADLQKRMAKAAGEPD